MVTERYKMKTYRAERHDVTRKLQKEMSPKVHHPEEKQKQIRTFMDIHKPEGYTLELSAGEGNLTKVYAEYNIVIAYETNKSKYEKLVTLSQSIKGDNNILCLRRDSYLGFHGHITAGKNFGVIDLAPYGFPNRFLPDIFLLMKDGLMFITMPKPSVNILNGITAQHLTCYWGCRNPSLEQIIEKLKLYSLCHWRTVEVLDVLDLKSVWRMCLKVKKVNACEYTGVKNR